MSDLEAEHAERMPGAGALTAWGVATVAFFAVVGVAPRELLSPDGAVGALLIMAPAIFAAALAGRGGVPSCARRGHTAMSGRRLAAWYIVLLVVAGATDLLAVRHGSLPALFVGFLPALPCFAFAWRLRRRRTDSISS
ncbi:hypothetical protein [Amycolatopsis sp. NPDC059021]|uniref:hypothetical protein n=1 Tax=Amycolatopsis sp. NPDC059021 TaxID=3346704 RepID=UPI00366EF47A